MLTPTASAVVRFICTSRPSPGDDIVLPGDLPYTLGVTERGLRNALARLTELGMIRWHRKRPGPPATPGYPVTILAHPAWNCRGDC